MDHPFNAPLTNRFIVEARFQFLQLAIAAVARTGLLIGF
jgi:ADP-dependent phosphofructokinase/glucokinase